MDEFIYTSLEDFLKDRHMTQELYALDPTPDDLSRMDADAIEKMYQQLLSNEKSELPKVNLPIKPPLGIPKDILDMIVENVKKDRDYIRRERRQLEETCRRFAIDISLFKEEPRKYCITREVALLFSFILNEFAKKRKAYNVLIKEPPIELLIALRAQILCALSSLDKDDSVIRRQLEAFEKKTGCPPKSYYIDHSPLTKEAIEYMKEDVLLSDLEWMQFADELENDYRHIYRAQFIAYSQKKLEKFLEEIGKSDLYPDEIGDIRKFFMRHTEKE